MSMTTEGKIVTFYSFKGGTGRTMALANVAWILASNGLKVLVVDWDLDSPGLHRYYHPFLDPAKVAATPGIIELITDYVWDAAQADERSPDWVRDYAQILPHAVSLSWEFPDGGTLDFVSAGRQNRDYSSAVTAIDWDNFYDRLEGGQFFDGLRADMKAHYDYTLIDSRTGLSDIADICTVHLPDILVDCFTLNDQSIDGAAAIARNVEQRYHYRNIQVLPVPMRIDEAEKDKADVGLATARARFGSSLHEKLGEYEANDYWAAVPIPYKPFYAFEETLAVFGDAPRSPTTLLGAYERLTGALTDGRVRALGAMSEEIRLTHKAAFIRPRQPPPGDIYLSYVPEDRMWADWITAVLAPRGIRILRPSGATVAGGNAREEAERGAASASRTIAILSAAYMQSPQAQGVWDAMGAADPAGTGRRLIPVRVGETRIEQPFSERSVVDLTRRDATQATEELLKALGYPPKLAEHLAGPEPRYPRTIPPVWRVPTRNASFTGRNDILEKLHDQLIGSSTAVVLPVALHGLGGVGKTQVAQEYAHRFMADYDLVWWVPSEQRDLINPSLAELAQHLGVRRGRLHGRNRGTGQGGAAPRPSVRPLAADLRQRGRAGPDRELLPRRPGPRHCHLAEPRLVAGGRAGGDRRVLPLGVARLPAAPGAGAHRRGRHAGRRGARRPAARHRAGGRLAGRDGHDRRGVRRAVAGPVRGDHGTQPADQLPDLGRGHLPAVVRPAQEPVARGGQAP